MSIKKEKKALRKALEKAAALHKKNEQKANQRGDTKLAAEERLAEHQLRRSIANLDWVGDS